MVRRLGLTGLISLLTACGGGSITTYVGQYGDSVSWGSCASCPTYRLEVPPVRRINELATGKFELLDFSLPGATVVDALQGGRAMPFSTFVAQMDYSPEKVVLLRFGGADALLGEDVEVFRAGLKELVKAALAKNKRPVITGIVWTSTPNTTLDLFNSVAKQVAEETQVKFLDLRSLPYSPEDSVDGLHPNQAYSDRISKFIVDQLSEHL